MELATDKQKAFMDTLGLNYPADISKDAAKAMISANVPDKPNNFGKPKENTFFKKSEPVPKKSYDNSSYYVAYAKDLVVAMLQNKAFDNMQLDVLMDNAILAINKAKYELKN